MCVRSGTEVKTLPTLFPNVSCIWEKWAVSAFSQKCYCKKPQCFHNCNQMFLLCKPIQIVLVHKPKHGIVKVQRAKLANRARWGQSRLWPEIFMKYNKSSLEWGEGQNQVITSKKANRCRGTTSYPKSNNTVQNTTNKSKYAMKWTKTGSAERYARGANVQKEENKYQNITGEFLNISE